MHWSDYLGLHFLKNGALSYIVSNESQVDWDNFPNKQKMDMVVLEDNHVLLIELKETDHKGRMGNVKFKQIERYQKACQDAKYKAEFWVYVYWKRYSVITGIKMDKVDNLQVFAIDKTGVLEFFASIGSDPKTRIRRKVDNIIEVK